MNELIFRFDARGELYRRFEAVSVDDRAIDALGRGETFDPARHPRGTLVKAATRHRLSFGRSGGLWVATVVFDV